MEILAETPFKILHQGLTDTFVEYKDIENDLPLHEQRKLESKPVEFKKIQTDFNSAEMYNKELRSEHSNVDSYKISEISEVYSTKKFKLFKIEQIISVCEYLQKVLKLIFNIDRQVTNLEKKTTKIANEKKFSSENDREIFRTKKIIESLLDQLSEIKVLITELENDSNSIEINSVVKGIWDTLLLSFAVYFVPDEFSSKIDSIFPEITLNKLSSLGDDLKDKKKVIYHLHELKNRLFLIINLFITNLSNQFSYYVTPTLFLNNPKGRAIFAIPISMYIMFDFYHSGLTKSEALKKEQKNYYSINSKQIKFFKSIDGYLKDLMEEAAKTRIKVLQEDEFFNIIEFLNYYETKVSNNRIKALESYFSDPVIYEKMTAMVQKVKQPMLVSMINKENPWDPVSKVKESKDMDNSTIYFLLKLHEMRFRDTKKVPQSQLQELLNLCTYSIRASTSCMNEHVSRYRKGGYRVTDSYGNLFEPILMN